jgi:hypothetical protein
VKPEAVARAEALLGTGAESWARVVRAGWSLNEHWTVELADGVHVFLKTGRIAPSPAWIRDEARILRRLQGVFAPRFIAFEDGDVPLLVLEDLMPARWPPPWHAGEVDLVLATLHDVALQPCDVPRLADEDWNGWRKIAADPGPFLSTGLRDPEWLERMLDPMLHAAEAAPLEGDELLRSDNLCVKDGRVVLVDWNHARRGDARLDIAFWLPSLALERGPDPDRFGVDEYAALVAGFFAARAGLPRPAGAPTVREFQRAQAAVALDWAERVL